MQKGKVLALDYGSKRVGIATGDFEDKIAFPRDVILNKGVDELVSTILKVAEELGVVLIVVGLPLNMEKDHFENRVMQDVRYFVKELKEELDEKIKVEFLDERLSSFEAGQILKNETFPSDRQKLGKDAYEAQVILQRFFDKM